MNKLTEAKREVLIAQEIINKEPDNETTLRRRMEIRNKIQILTGIEHGIKYEYVDAQWVEEGLAEVIQIVRRMIEERDYVGHSTGALPFNNLK